MNSESILLAMAPEEKERARKIAAACNCDDCLDPNCDCTKMSGLTLLGIINDRVLPEISRTPDGQRVVTGLGDLSNILSGIDIQALAKSFGVAAVNVVREQVLPKIREASATAALIVSNLLELVEGKLREA